MRRIQPRSPGRTSVPCRGGMYSKATIMEKPRTATHYGWTSAVCDLCGTRLYLEAGGKLPSHWLTVTIHEVRGNIHNPEND